MEGHLTDVLLWLATGKSGIPVVDEHFTLKQHFLHVSVQGHWSIIIFPIKAFIGVKSPHFETKPDTHYVAT